MKEAVSILVVDDESSMRTYLETILSQRGYKVSSVKSGKEVLELIEKGLEYSVIILDIMMPEIDGLVTLQKIRELEYDFPVIMLSALGQASMVVKAMKFGASDYTTKPFEDEELEITINNVLEKRKLIEEVKSLEKQLDEKNSEEYFVNVSKSLEEVKETARKIEDTDVTVLIHGESGVGKEVVAKYVHSSSLRRDKAFIKVSCVALPSELLESELFGYEKGAFTGAYIPKPGRFGLAHQGTIFLDEIGDMPMPLQSKLLQVLQDGVFTRLGANEETRVDVRILAATNKNLETAVKERTFREDLYHRINVVNLHIPPLRKRKEDIPVLCEYLLQRYNRKYNRKIKSLSKDLMKLFMKYDWPGNVRELENMIKRVIVLRDESPILAGLAGLAGKAQKDIEKYSDSSLPPASPAAVSLKNISRSTVKEVEKEIILKVLDQTNWNRRKAALQLGINYKTLLYKLKKMI